MKILLLVSAFNGLTQRTWIELRRAGHDVTVELDTSDDVVRDAVRSTRPDLVLCPYLEQDSTERGRLPAEVWQMQPTVVVHLGPIGSLGPNPLGWAILDGTRTWGVTALQAVGATADWPVWSTQQFTMPYGVRSKSALYYGPVADAVMAVVHDVVGKLAARPRTFTPVPLAAFAAGERLGRPRPAVPSSACQLDWHRDSSDDVLRKVAASDGAPGAECVVGGERLLAFDAQPSAGDVVTRGGPRGGLRARRDGPVLLPTADGAVWIGHLARHGEPKLPARYVLARHPRLVEGWPPDAEGTAPGHVRDIRYRRFGPVGWIDFDFYNGAMSTDHCRRLLSAFVWATRQDTRVIVLRGGDTAFSNGIHLNLIEMSDEPNATASQNIEALNDLCEAFITTTDQLLVAGLSGNAGAGGAMMALGADVVAARSGIVLNPHYATTGLFGSGYWTYTLPRRVGSDLAAELTTAGLPIGGTEARQIGMVDEVLPRDPSRFDEALHTVAAGLAGPGFSRAVAAKSRRREADERSVPLAVYRARERARLAADVFSDDTHACLRHEFVSKSPPARPPSRISVRRDVPRRVAVPTGHGAAWASGVWDGAGARRDQPSAGRPDRAGR